MCWLAYAKSQLVPQQCAYLTANINRLVQTGSKVIYSRYAGTEVEFQGEEHLILKEEDVIGLLDTDDVKDMKPLGDRVLIKVSTLYLPQQTGPVFLVITGDLSSGLDLLLPSPRPLEVGLISNNKKVSLTAACAYPLDPQIRMWLKIVAVLGGSCLRKRKGFCHNIWKVTKMNGSWVDRNGSPSPQ